MGSFFNASVSSVIPNIVEEEAFTSANSIKEILIQFAWIFGSGVSGFLYAQIGIVMILIIDGISFILSGLSESLIDIPRTKVCLDNSMFKDFVEGVKYVKTKKMILVLIGIEFILSFSISPAFRILMPMLVKFQLGLSSKEFGLVEIMLSIGTILGAHYVTSQVDEKHIFRKISKAIVGIGGGFFFMALMSSLNMINRIGQFHVFVSICIGVIAIGILHIAVLIPIKTIYQLNIADDYRGRFYGFYYSAFKISMPSGILMYSFLAKFFSIDKLYLIMSIPLIMIGGVIYSKRIHHHLT